MVYTDTGAWGKVEKPLYYHALGLTGKPDYLVERDGILIPVEVKSGRTPEAPYDSHIFQLAAYCLFTSYFHWQLRADPWQVTIMVKNWAVAGGLLILAAQGPGRWALRWPKRA